MRNYFISVDVVEVHNEEMLDYKRAESKVKFDCLTGFGG